MLEKIKKVAKSAFGQVTMEEDQQEPIYKEDIAKFVKDEFTRRQKERLPFELQMRLNINFHDGNQYSIIDDQRGTIEEKDKLYYWEVRRVYNHIAPIVDTRLAKLSRASVTLKVRPATSDNDDISSAKISTKILESAEKNQHESRLQLRANTWSEICGTSIWKPTWNPSKGRVLGQVQMESEEMHMGMHSNQVNPTKTYREGDIETIVCSPFEIYPESCYKPYEEQRSFVHAKAYHIDEIYETWGIRVKGQKVNVFSVKNIPATGGLGSKGVKYSIASAVQENSAMVYEYWELPSRKYPKGRLLIVADGHNEPIHAGDLPYMLGDDGEYKLPFIPQYCLEQAGTFFGKSIVERLIDVQTQYNALRNRKTEYLNRVAIGQLSYEEGTIDEEMLEQDGLAPGAMIPRKVGSAPPSYLQTPQLPTTFADEEQRLLNLFTIISGVSEISRDSSAPTGVGSGIALSLLKEQDDTRISLTAQQIQNSKIERGKMYLKFYKQFVEVPRMLRNVGKNDIVEVLEWDANSITSFDVYIESSSQLSETPAQRKQMVFDLLQSGLFNDPDTGRITKEGRLKIFEMLEMGNWEDYDEQNSLQKQKARRENREMLQGVLPVARDFDDDIIHITTHNNYRLSSEYEDKLKENPQLDQFFEQHLQMHFANIQAKMPPQPQEEEQKIV